MVASVDDIAGFQAKPDSVAVVVSTNQETPVIQNDQPAAAIGVKTDFGDRYSCFAAVALDIADNYHTELVVSQAEVHFGSAVFVAAARD